MPNNKANVSTTRGVQGGYFFSAPKSATDVPDSYTWVPGSEWECQGYIPEDGFKESVSFDGDGSLRDLNQDIVDETEGAPTETLQITLMEMAKNPLSTIYGHENVTDSSGLLKVEHNWGKASEERQYALLLLLKNGRKWVKHIKQGTVNERGDFIGNAKTAGQRQVTIKYLVDEDGSYCTDYIQSTETTAP